MEISTLGSISFALWKLSGGKFVAADFYNDLSCDLKFDPGARTEPVQCAAVSAREWKGFYNERKESDC